MATVGASEVYYQPELTTMVVNSYGHIQGVHSSTMYPLDMTFAFDNHISSECLLLDLMATVGASEVNYQPEFTTSIVNSYNGHIQVVHSS